MRRLRSPLQLPESHALPAVFAELFAEALRRAEHEYSESLRAMIHDETDATRARHARALADYAALEAAIAFAALPRATALA